MMIDGAVALRGFDETRARCDLRQQIVAVQRNLVLMSVEQAEFRQQSMPLPPAPDAAGRLVIAVVAPGGDAADRGDAGNARIERGGKQSDGSAATRAESFCFFILRSVHPLIRRRRSSRQPPRARSVRDAGSGTAAMMVPSVSRFAVSQ